MPGTRGLRAQHARIEAIWLSARVPRRLVRRVRARYPSAIFYGSKRLMLRHHPPTRLDSYWPEPRRRRRRYPSRARERLWAFTDPNAVFVVASVVFILALTQLLRYVL